MTTAPDESPRPDEQLSAWLDDELPAAEQEFLLARLAKSPDDRARLARYSLIGSALRASPAVTGVSAIAALQVSTRVGVALDQPAQPGSAPGITPERQRRGVLPYAMAAGVALLAVALIPLLRPPGPPPGVPGPARASNEAQPAASLSPVAARGGQASLSTRRLTNYLVYHGEYSGVLSAKLTDSHIINNPSDAVRVSAAEGLAAP